MSLKKKIISLITGAALILASALTFSGCSPSVATALTVNGEDISAGLYILYSGNAYANATQKLSEEQPDLGTAEEGFDYYAQTVSGMSFADYVKQETLDLCKRHTAINMLFDTLNIVFDETEQDTINDYINSQWDYDLSSWNGMEAFSYLKGADTLGEYYESIGISKSSFKQYTLNSYRASEVFTYYYGEGGIEEVSKDEIKAWIDDNYSLARYFGVSLSDNDGNLIEDESQLAALENMAEDYKDKLNDGGSFADVYELYYDYSEMTAASDEAAENTTVPEADEAAETAAEEKDDNAYNSLIAKTSTTPSEEFVKALFEQEKNTAAVFKADTYYYVVQRLDVLDTEGADGDDEIDYVERYSATALQELKGDTMEDVLKGEYANYTLTENSSAPDYCRQQAENALNGLTTITQIQYQYQYYQQLFGGM